MLFSTLRHAVVAALLLAGFCVFADTPAALTPEQALTAIRNFEGNLPTSIAVPGKSAKQATAALAEAANAIVSFAVRSDAVIVDMGPDSVTWCDVKKGVDGMSHGGERGLLFAAYVAGSVKAQLASGKPDANPYEGWVSAIKLYKGLRARDGLRISELDTLSAKMADGSLEAFAADAQKRALARLESDYHGERPVSLAFSGR
jgi:hypothetical protein